METFSALLALCAGNSPVNSPHKGQWRGAWTIFPWTNGWVNNRDAGDLRRHRAHHDGAVMFLPQEEEHQASYSYPGSSNKVQWRPSVVHIVFIDRLNSKQHTDYNYDQGIERHVLSNSYMTYMVKINFIYSPFGDYTIYVYVFKAKSWCQGNAPQYSV